jgi:biotin carboxyl carrier protein
MEVIIEAGGWVVFLSQMTLTFDNSVYTVEVKGNTVVVNEHEYTVTENGSDIVVDAIPFAVEFRGDHVMVNGIQHTYRMGAPPLQKLVKKSVPGSGAITAIMPGRIIAVSVKEGDTVQEGDVICILEAMKMENEIRAARGGNVRNVAVKAGAIVEKDQVLVEIE